MAGRGKRGERKEGRKEGGKPCQVGARGDAPPKLGARAPGRPPRFCWHRGRAQRRRRWLPGAPPRTRSPARPGGPPGPEAREKGVLGLGGSGAGARTLPARAAQAPPFGLAEAPAAESTRPSRAGAGGLWRRARGVSGVVVRNRARAVATQGETRGPADYKSQPRSRRAAPRPAPTLAPRAPRTSPRRAGPAPEGARETGNP